MRHDTQTYLLAWHHFRREPWQWPPGKILGVGYPVTTSIGNTDAVPLVAFPLKPLHALLPDPGQYLGAWLLACYVLQGVFGALLVRQVTADRTLQVLGAALFVQTPALLFRTGHTALCGHWLLLAAIWIAASHSQRSYRWRLLAWSLVSAAVAATQPYLAVMVLGLAAADFASDALWPRFSAPAVPGAAWRARPRGHRDDLRLLAVRRLPRRLVGPRARRPGLLFHESVVAGDEHANVVAVARDPRGHTRPVRRRRLLRRRLARSHGAGDDSDGQAPRRRATPSARMDRRRRLRALRDQPGGHRRRYRGPRRHAARLLRDQDRRRAHRLVPPGEQLLRRRRGWSAWRPTRPAATRSRPNTRACRRSPAPRSTRTARST